VLFRSAVRLGAVSAGSGTGSVSESLRQPEDAGTHAAHVEEREGAEELRMPFQKLANLPENRSSKRAASLPPGRVASASSTRFRSTSSLVCLVRDNQCGKP